jgi:hypothetical protein
MKDEGEDSLNHSSENNKTINLIKFVIIGWYTRGSGSSEIQSIKGCPERRFCRDGLDGDETSAGQCINLNR